MDNLNGIEYMKEVYNSRADQYGRAVFRFAHVKDEKGTHLLRGVMYFDREEPKLKKELEYDSLLLVEDNFQPEDGIEFIEMLLTNGTTPKAGKMVDGVMIAPWIGKEYKIAHPTFWDKELPIPVGNHRLFNWPAKILLISKSANNWNDPSGPLITKEQPIIVEPHSTVQDWIWGSRPVDYSTLSNGIMLILPDYRVCIRRIQIKEFELLVEIELGVLTEDDIIIKGVFRSEGVTNEVELTRKGDSYYAPISRIPDHFYIFALDKEHWEILDWADINLNDWRLPPEIEFAMPGQQIRHIIDSGENESIEFKEKLTLKLIQSVVAFANSGEGIILIGVADDCSIVGTDPVKDQEKIIEWIDKKCDPPINVFFEHIEIDDEMILVVRVPEGDNKPYMHRESGRIYVRRSSTDRHAKRSEIDAFYKDRNPNSSFRF